MKILHICAGWQPWNGAANIARLIMGEQEREGHRVEFATWAGVRRLRAADEVWIHCGWMPCLWWTAVWGRSVHWMPEACYDPVRLKYHGWKKWLVGPIERFCLRRAKTIVATCEAERTWIQSCLGKRCPSVEVTNVRRFFNFPDKAADSGGARTSKDRPAHLLYMGRRHPLKGLELLEEAVKDAPNVELRAVSNAFGDEKEMVWQWCDVLVLPTLSENFGLVVAEALERGKPVVTTDGAPAWRQFFAEHPDRGVYLEGFVMSPKERRVEMLVAALDRMMA